LKKEVRRKGNST